MTRFLQGLRALFNLNDPGWGRDAGTRPGSGNDQDQGSDAGKPPQPPANPPEPERRPAAPQQRPQEGQNPPDLDELWGDLNRKLSNMFGGKGGGRGQRPPGGGNRGGFPGGIRPPALSGGLIGLVAGILLALWLASGFFIVQEGYQAVVTRFGKFDRTVSAGLNYRFPAPIERHESVLVTQIQSVDIGNDRIIQETGLNHYAMLTEDENIVEVRFAVQYRLSDARAWLFETQDPRLAVITAAETAVREVVGKMKMDNVLAGERDQIAPRVRELMQVILDRYKVGVEVVAINMQQSGVRPPEQVRDAFDDVLRADQERERAKNEAEAYANNVIPRAVGEASRIREEALAYKDRVLAQAEGDSERFDAVYVEYQKAPVVTRERLYLETMEEVYRNSNKVLVDSNNGSSLMYLPLDKLLEQSGGARTPAVQNNPAGGNAAAASQAAQSQQGSTTSTGTSDSSGLRRPSRDGR
ncbi:protease FtsH subunit HflK [Corticibacter populi]|nr:protease FtsH subunit HflK [Corticibacter populi]